MQGFEYKMRFVYAHFPINVAITGAKNKVEIRNFLGEKVVRIVDAAEGVTVVRSADVKDEIVVVGNDIENVSKTWCATTAMHAWILSPSSCLDPPPPLPLPPVPPPNRLDAQPVGDTGSPCCRRRRRLAVP